MPDIELNPLQIEVDSYINEGDPGVHITPTSPYSSYNGPDFPDATNTTTINSSFCGCDVTTIVQLNNKFIVLANLETFSYSIFREKSPVRVLGRSYPKGFVSGGRTIAGSMVFIVFDKSPLYDVVKEINYVKNPGDRKSSPMPDQLPPLDLILMFHNEYGLSSVMRLYGVEFVQEGQVHSINDIYSENTMQYIARDMDQMIAFSEVSEFKDLFFERQMLGQFTDNYLGSMIDYRNSLQTQINNCDKIIAQIESAKTTGDIASLDMLGLNLKTIQNLNTEESKQIQIREYLSKELYTVAGQILQYEQNIRGNNAQNSDYGVTGRPNLNQVATI